MSNMISRQKTPQGFTLIELMVVISIIGILAATSIPSYKVYLDKVRLLAGEVELVQSLKDFSVLRDYSPPTGLLADLVSEGFIKKIPNDPWTSQNAVNTGAEEDVDWYYSNDGSALTLYAYSHPDRKYILPSFGKAPLDSPVIASRVSVAPVSDVNISQLKSKESTEVLVEGNKLVSEEKDSKKDSEAKDSKKDSEAKDSKKDSEEKDSKKGSEEKDNEEDS